LTLGGVSTFCKGVEKKEKKGGIFALDAAD
jgi:hypothetical protein